MKSNKFKYKALKGLVNIDTLSPNKKLFYKIQKPFDFYWGCFVAKIAFYSVDRELLYYDSEFNANHLGSLNVDNEKLNFVNWSTDGTLAFFNERKYDDINVLYDTLIDFEESVVFKIEVGKRENIPEDSPVNILTNETFTREFALNYFASGQKHEMKKEKVKDSKLLNLFGKSLWHP